MKLKSEALSDMSGILIRRGRDTSSVVYDIFYGSSYKLTCKCIYTYMKKDILINI